jgi:hypothetical protein
MTKINLEIELVDALSVLQALVREQEGFTQDPTCTPDRIARIRKVILELDKAMDDASKDGCPPGTIAVNGECADL